MKWSNCRLILSGGVVIMIMVIVIITITFMIMTITRWILSGGVVNTPRLGTRPATLSCR